jgi:hypothetical protein
MSLLESFANAVLDLGLPAVEAWLRGRFGPEARIASLRIEDGLVRIEGAHLPLGGRARLRVREATLSATRGERLASSPALRLRSLVGTLELDDEKAGIGAFAAPVDFTPEPRDDDAWVAGMLSVRGATWTRAHGAGEAPPLDGRVRVRVTSESWAIEGGAFAAGRTQIDLDARGATGGGRIDRVRFAVRHARAGHLADAVSAILGRELPSWLETAARAEVDARVEWGAAQGGEAHAALRTDAGSALTLVAHLDTADLRSVEVRGSLCLDDVPWAPLRRLESARSAKLELLAHGTGPQATFTLDVALHGDAAIVGAEGPLGLTVRARAAAGAIQWSASLVGAGRASLRLTSSPGARGEVRFTDLEPPWVLALATLAGARSTPTLPVALRVSGEITLEDGAATARLEARTPASRLVLDGLRVRREDRYVEEGMVTGSIDVADARLLGLVPDAVTLGEGAAVRCALVVAGAPTELCARGDLSSERLVVSLASRPDVPPLSLRDVAVEIELSRAGLAWRELAFACEGAQIHGEGAVAFRGTDGDAPLLALRTARAPASLLRALACFAGLRLDATRLPPELSTSAEMHVRAGGHVHVEGSLDSAESAIAVDLDVERDGAIAGAFRGRLGFGDARLIGIIPDTPWSPARDGYAEVDATLSGSLSAPVVRGTARAERLAIAPWTTVPPLAFEEVSARLHVDREKLGWNRLRARFLGGVVSSLGLLGWRGSFVGLELRVLVEGARVGELPVRSGVVAQWIDGRARGVLRLGRRAHGALFARGRLVVDDAHLAGLGALAKQLAPFGLAPPPLAATAPLSVVIAAHGGEWHFTELSARVPGVRAEGTVHVGSGGVLAGDLDVHLEESYLRSSALLSLLSVLVGDVVVPVELGGTLGAPRARADLGEALSRFLPVRVAGAVVGALGRALAGEERRGAVPGDAAPQEARPDDAALRAALDDAGFDAAACAELLDA